MWKTDCLPPDHQPISGRYCTCDGRYRARRRRPEMLIRAYSDLVSPGTRFIFSAPAFNFLWSAHDVFLEHHRRYTLQSLNAAMRESGLVVDWGHYYYGAVFPLAAGMRLFERLKSAHVAEPKSQLQKHSAFVNATLAALLAAERPVMGMNKPVRPYCLCRWTQAVAVIVSPISISYIGKCFRPPWVRCWVDKAVIDQTKGFCEPSEYCWKYIACSPTNRRTLISLPG